MFTYDCVLVAVLLTSPVDPADVAARFELIQPALMQLAIDAEILDPREEQYLQGLSKDPAGDYQALRQRFARFLSAPALLECGRFPARALIEDFLAFNRAYRKELRARLDSLPPDADELRTALNEVDQLHLVWSTLRDARSPLYYVMYRREALEQVRDLIGAEAFYRAELPPPLPLRHFPRLP